MFVKSIVKKLCLAPLNLICMPIKKTYWYRSFFVGENHEIYPDNVWYRKHVERNYDVVNLGSSSAKWAFDYSDLHVKAMNWAQQPQTLLEDFNLLRNYHSILKKNGFVLVVIMPFTSLNKKTNYRDAMKYLKLDAHEPIQPNQITLARRYARFPILMGKNAVKALVRYALGKEKVSSVELKANLEYNPMTDAMLEEDALRWIDGWKKQFEIESLDGTLSLANQEGRKYRIDLMRKLVDFCIEREYRPVFVIPPVTKFLSKYFSENFEENFIYSFLRDVNSDIPLLDYSKCTDMCDSSLFFNSFFLNRRGAKFFTQKVLADLGAL